MFTKQIKTESLPQCEVKAERLNNNEQILLHKGDVLECYYLVALITMDPEVDLMVSFEQFKTNALKSTAQFYHGENKIMVWNCEKQEIEAIYERVVPYNIENGANTTAYGDFIRTR